MKKLLIYYFIILVPIPFIGLLAYMKYSTLFAISILIYALVYRPFIDCFKLLRLGFIRKTDVWKVFIPFWSMKWQNRLYTTP